MSSSAQSRQNNASGSFQFSTDILSRLRMSPSELTSYLSIYSFYDDFQACISLTASITCWINRDIDVEAFGLLLYHYMVYNSSIHSTTHLSQFLQNIKNFISNADLKPYIEQNLSLSLILIGIGLLFAVTGFVIFDRGAIALGVTSINIGMFYLLGYQKYSDLFLKNKVSSIGPIGQILGQILIIKGQIFFGLVIEFVSFLLLFQATAAIITPLLRHVPLVKYLFMKA